VHVKIDHCKANSSQTDEILMETKFAQTRKDILIDKIVQTQSNFDDPPVEEYEKYSCFYCEKEITSELHLLEHGIVCLGATENPSLFSFPVRPRPLLYKCVVCGLVTCTKAEMVDLKKSVHGN
jgi:hypothetical protein